MFTITMLPARVGDCLWIEYGDPAAPRRVLIDAGTSPTWASALRARLEGLGPRSIELLIVTHVDTDHIGGVLPMFEAAPPRTWFKQVWFNAWRHLAPESLDILGPIDGEILTRQIHTSGASWNRAFHTNDRAARTPRTGRLRAIELAGGLRLTIVAPRRTELDILKPEWEKVVRDAGLIPGVPSQTLIDKAAGKGIAIDLLGDPIAEWAAYEPSDLDSTEANGSSIAVYAEFDDGGITKRALFAGDAHGPVLERGVRRLARQLGEDRLRVDAFKAPHHGSLKNVTRDLVRTIDARIWLFSSNGVRHGHPHKEAVARVLVDGDRPRSLKFNYRSEQNKRWDTAAWKAKYGYDTEYGDGTLTISL
jgi:hypothetical protein